MGDLVLDDQHGTSLLSTIICHHESTDFKSSDADSKAFITPSRSTANL